MYSSGDGVQEDATAGGRVEVGQKWCDARRAGQKARHVALRAGAVFLLEGDVAIGVDERRGLPPPVEVERERDIRRSTVIVGERELATERGPETRGDAPDVISSGSVAGESQPEPAQVVRVGRRDEITVVLNDRDLADIDAVASGSLRRLGGAASCRRSRAVRSRHCAASRCSESASKTRYRVSRSSAVRLSERSCSSGGASSELLGGERGAARIGVAAWRRCRGTTAVAAVAAREQQRQDCDD